MDVMLTKDRSWSFGSQNIRLRDTLPSAGAPVFPHGTAGSLPRAMKPPRPLIEVSTMDCGNRLWIVAVILRLWTCDCGLATVDFRLSTYSFLSSSRIASKASMTSCFGTFPLRNLSFRLNALLGGR